MNREEELINQELLPQEIYQNVLGGTANIRKAFRLLENIEINNPNQEIQIEAANVRILLAKSDKVWQTARRNENIEKYISEGVDPSEAPVIALLELLRREPISNADRVIKEWEIEEEEEEGEIVHWTYEDIEWSDNMLMVYTLNEKGYINRITSEHGELPTIGVFPEQLCTLTHLTELALCAQGIKTIPECIGKLKKLEKLDLSDNGIQKLPTSIKKLTNLKFLRIGDGWKDVSDSNRNVFPQNLSEFVDIFNNKT